MRHWHNPFVFNSNFFNSIKDCYKLKLFKWSFFLIISTYIPFTFSQENIIHNEPIKPSRIQPYQAEYSIFDGKKKMGSALRSLTIKNNQWLLTMSTEISKYFYKLEFKETSRFLTDGFDITPLHYESVTKRSFKDDRIITSQFDWKKMLEIGSYNESEWHINLSELVTDHLNFQHLLRLKAPLNLREQQIKVSYKGHIDKLDFFNEGYEKVSTEFGTFDTVLWAQQIENKGDKYFLFWLAPELDYFPVQLAQFRNGKPEGVIKLKSLTYLNDDA